MYSILVLFCIHVQYYPYVQYDFICVGDALPSLFSFGNKDYSVLFYSFSTITFVRWTITTVVLTLNNINNKLYMKNVFHLTDEHTLPLHLSCESVCVCVDN